MCDQSGVVGFDRQEINHRAADLGGFSRRVQFDQRGQAILRQQAVALRTVRRAHTGPDDGPVQRFALLHQTVQIPRLMRTVKIAKTDVHDPSRQCAAIISRTRDALWQVRQCRSAKRRQAKILSTVCHLFIPAQLIHWPPSTL